MIWEAGWAYRQRNDDGRVWLIFCPRFLRATPPMPVRRWQPRQAIDGATIEAALKTVHDPEIPVNIFDLGLIYHVNIG